MVPATIGVIISVHRSVGALELAEELVLTKGSGNPVLGELRRQRAWS